MTKMVLTMAKMGYCGQKLWKTGLLTVRERKFQAGDDGDAGKKAAEAPTQDWLRLWSTPII